MGSLVRSNEIDLYEDKEVLDRWDFFVQEVNNLGGFHGPATGNSTPASLRDISFFRFLRGVIGQYRGINDQNEPDYGIEISYYSNRSQGNQREHLLSPAEKLDVLASVFFTDGQELSQNEVEVDEEESFSYRSSFLHAAQSMGTVKWADILLLVWAAFQNADPHDKRYVNTTPKEVVSCIWSMYKDSEFEASDLHRFSAPLFLEEFPIENALNLIDAFAGNY